MDTVLLDNFEKTLQSGLIKLCSGAGIKDFEILDCPDVENVWNDSYIKDFISDAVVNFNDYPQSTIAWAGFLGMAVACHWDRDWEIFRNDPYSSYYGERGFDDMDEHILGAVLKFNDADTSRYSSLMSSCAMAALGLIRHEGIEAQTDTGFFILARSYTVLYRVGMSLMLNKLGYRKVLMNR